MSHSPANAVGDGIRRRAVLSECGAYRYNLSRDWDGSGYRATFIMLNPSTADADIDDPTIRRCMGFARSWDYSGIRVLNLYALRSSDPKALKLADDPVGPVNDAHIAIVADDVAFSGEPIVAAWGVHADPERVAQVLEIVRSRGARLTSFGVTKSGAPRHPLYLPRTAELAAWPPITERKATA